MSAGLRASQPASCLAPFCFYTRASHIVLSLERPGLPLGWLQSHAGCESHLPALSLAGACVCPPIHVCHTVRGHATQLRSWHTAVVAYVSCSIPASATHASSYVDSIPGERDFWPSN